ncbi:hypothetical protein FZEAL_6917 [Fusarium zealandicum]|uniref:Short-chain dehydrogenase/reductase n=1 Tax=Fusarium zealandicum TaxID=1053134 RepID=A0A8H4XJ01_9HYPO|nr:hypothetical protein FZEAL_6917 [Fusarium zealandicum]
MASEKNTEMGVAEFIRHQSSSLPMALTATECAGKTYIVTGSNIGLGLECSKHLVKLGSKKVIMAVRSLERGQAALAAVEAETLVKGVAEVWQLDMGDYGSVKTFAARVERDLERVDGILENAAAANGSWIVTEGMESTIAVNVVGTVLLAVLLMPYLSRCAKNFRIQPRIGIVTSGLGFSREVDLSKIDKTRGILGDVNDSSKWDIDGTNRYSLSKLLQVFAVRRLAQLAPVEKTGIIINLIGPGLCSTGLVRYLNSPSKLLVGGMRLVLGRSAEWGSRTLIHGIAAGEESHGKFLSYCQVKEEWVPRWVSNAQGDEWAVAIWDEVAGELEKIQPSCVGKALQDL